MKLDRLGYLGPRGTFSEEAALSYNRIHGRQLLEYPSITAVITAVMRGDLEEGIVPLENILEGGIAVTLDQLARQEGVYICHELLYPIRQCLMAGEETTLDQLRQVYSHPHALGQCSEFIEHSLPGVECIPVESTAAAARQVIGCPGKAAIAPRRAAELFKLCLLAEGIEDNEGNATRFVTLSRQDHSPTGDDKTSMVLTVSDEPGSLYRMLGLFAHRHINLTRIESRPSRQIIGDWLFFIDCAGHHSDLSRTDLWNELRQVVPFFKLLGSYPVNQKVDPMV